MSIQLCNMQMKYFPGCACGLSRLRVADVTRPIRAGRKNGRQPGNKPPPFERSVWAAPGWRPVLREFLRRRVAFSLGTFFWRSKRKYLAAARKAADKHHPHSGVTIQNKVGRNTVTACGQPCSFHRGKY
ncbi:hypothetical protein [Vogesella indigofera]|uniref:Uncharacterized protein n=1 Tax=Vogesella indigofera TaxID=45465 RepID=A0ABT5HZF5_VOGIN|nr:hypothetical protein [Vogesella indigofera]MDC7689298.1 hypothetical protein [Vogesella indigofera]